MTTHRAGEIDRTLGEQRRPVPPTQQPGTTTPPPSDLTQRGPNVTPSKPASTEPDSAQSNASMGELVSRLSEEMSSLVRGEMELARLELTEKAKHAGKGAGAFGGAGLVALYGLGVLIATAILALALVLDAWLAALIVGVVLLAIAGVMALVGKKQVSEGIPMKPQRATENVKRDMETVKHRGHDQSPVVRSKP